MARKWWPRKQGNKQPAFERPEGWHNLDGTPPAQPPPQSAPEPARRSPQDFPPPVPLPPVQPPPGAGLPYYPSALPHPVHPTKKLKIWGGRLAFALVLMAFFAICAGALWAAIDPGEPSSGDIPNYQNRPYPTEDAPTQWVLLPGDLRPDLPEPQYETHFDGFMDSNVVIDGGDTWAVLTRDDQGLNGQAHGIDPETGEEVWSTPLDGTMCAEDLLDGHFVCAEALEREETLGTRWAIHLLDPATGEATATAEVDAWITGMIAREGHVILLEQRLPAPHAAVTALDAELNPAWDIDLRLHEGNREMFSENRLWIRAERVPDGPALLRPRVRDVGDGLVALWVGGRTAFIEPASGEVVGMPRCSRLVDDGERIWCNDGDRTVAYDHNLNRLFETDEDVRLAFPNSDRRESDVSPPIFVRSNGQLVRVDPATGETAGRLLNTRNSSIFGMSAPPDVATAGGHTLVSTPEETFGIDLETGEVLWEQPVKTSLQEMFVDGDHLLLGGHNIVRLDPVTGETVGHWDLEYGFGVTAIGDQFLGASLDELALLDLP